MIRKQKLPRAPMAPPSRVIVPKPKRKPKHKGQDETKVWSCLYQRYQRRVAEFSNADVA